MEAISGVIKFIKSPYLSLVIATLGATILFAPDSFAETFGFAQIRNNHIAPEGIPARTIVGLATVVSAISFVYLSVIKVWQWNDRRRRCNRLVDSVKYLSPDEVTILRYCFNQQQETVSLEATHHAALALASKGILIQGPVRNILAVPFTVRDFIWDYIRDNPAAIFGATGPNDPTVRAELEQFHRHLNRNNF